jgi:hypothetical protein
MFSFRIVLGSNALNAHSKDSSEPTTSEEAPTSGAGQKRKSAFYDIMKEVRKKYL